MEADIMYEFKAARLATVQENQETICCHLIKRHYMKKLLLGIELTQKSFTTDASFLKAFYRYKAIELLSEVALQDMYPKGQRYALSILTYFY